MKEIFNKYRLIPNGVIKTLKGAKLRHHLSNQADSWKDACTHIAVAYN